jgi:hypothetical protein
MLDTIWVKYPIGPSADQLAAWTHKVTETTTGRRESYIYNPVIEEVALRFTYFPAAYDGKPMLTLEASLPKVVLNNNYQMIGSIDGAIKLGNMTLEDLPHVPKLDLAEGILIRLDMCYNHQVGETVEDYIRALGNLDYPHRRTKHHRYEGVEFRAKHKTTKFYSKERECRMTEAHGILRQEITLLRGKDIQKLIGKKQPTLQDITKEFVTEQLQEDLVKLGLLGNSITTHDTALEMLSRAHGNLAGPYYFGLLMTKQDKSRKQIAQATHMHPRSLDRRLQQIVHDGIPLTFTDRGEPLRPLTIDL